MDLQVDLITGDVNQIGNLDFLLIGHKNPLRSHICEETKRGFELIDSNSWLFPHQYERLEAPDYKWKRVAAIKFRSNGKPTETQFVRISSPLADELRSHNPRTIGLLPPTWHNPQYCALGMMYALWLVGYAAAVGSLGQRFTNPATVQFKIVSQTGTNYFEQVLADDCQMMWNFIKELCQQNSDGFAPQYKNLKRIPVNFDITKFDFTQTAL